MPEETMRNIVERIKSRRIELEYSFQDLADLTGMSKSTLQRYETGGIKNIPLDKLKTLARALKVSPEWIMGWELAAEKNPESASEHQFKYSSNSSMFLDEETAKKALEIRDDASASILLDAKRDLKKEDLDYIVGLIKRLRTS
jgi:transcriptional regulator with XRE-family HTH domain